jgi:hypothetical protein
MVCVVVPLLLKRNIGVLFGVLRGSRSIALCFVVMPSCFRYAVLRNL